MVQVGKVRGHPTKMVILLGTEYPEWVSIMTEVTIHELIQFQSKPQDTIIHTDGSVKRESNRCGLNFVTCENGRNVERKSAAYSRTTSNIRTEIQAAMMAFT